MNDKFCPSCGSDNVESDGLVLQEESGKAVQNNTCGFCGTKFAVAYVCAGVFITENKPVIHISFGCSTFNSKFDEAEETLTSLLRDRDLLKVYDNLGNHYEVTATLKKID
jgi:hypothetical protein